MASRIWTIGFVIALVAYLVAGTALLTKAMNAQETADAVTLIAAADILLFAAAFTCPSWWVLALPLVTFVPVGAWGVSECEPNFLDLCGLVWFASAFVAIVGVPIAALAAWLGHEVRASRPDAVETS